MGSAPGLLWGLRRRSAFTPNPCHIDIEDIEQLALAVEQGPHLGQKGILVAGEDDQFPAQGHDFLAGLFDPSFGFQLGFTDNEIGLLKRLRFGLFPCLLGRDNGILQSLFHITEGQHLGIQIADTILERRIFADGRFIFISHHLQERFHFIGIDSPHFPAEFLTAYIQRRNLQSIIPLLSGNSADNMAKRHEQNHAKQR